MTGGINWNPGALDKEADESARTVGLFVEATAKRACPIGPTGNLNRSITMVKAGTARVEVGTNVNYAAYVEYGTRYMAARPYLKPALAAARSKYGGILG